MADKLNESGRLGKKACIVVLSINTIGTLAASHPEWIPCAMIVIGVICIGLMAVQGFIDYKTRSNKDGNEEGE